MTALLEIENKEDQGIHKVHAKIQSDKLGNTKVATNEMNMECIIISGTLKTIIECHKIETNQLQLLTDPDMLLFFEQGTRGGISKVTHNFGKAHNKYMEEKFDPEKTF